jgi:prepilin-type N-terminal cleavage/methylation domain-containing protein
VIKIVRKNTRGVTLVEVMVSIVIICTVMMTFAMVFPSGYRVNLKSKNENTAAKLANGIIDKIQNAEFSRANLLLVDSDTPTIENLQNWDSAKKMKFTNYFGLDKMPENFFLPDDQNPVYDSSGKRLNGIEVVVPEIDPTFAYIIVRVAWKETVGGEVKTKYTTLTTCRSSNHK